MANGLENIKEEIVDQIDDLEQQVEDLDLENELEKKDDEENDQNDTGVHEDDEEVEPLGQEDLAVNDEGLHPLERQWCMWFMNGSKPNKDSKKGGHQNNGWNQGLIELANFGTENQQMKSKYHALLSHSFLLL